MCVCVCVCYREFAASISSLASWCMMLCIYIHICKYTNVQTVYKDSLGMQHTPIPAYAFWSQLPLLQPLQTCRIAAVKIEGIKGEVTVMSKAACFHFSQLRTSTSAGLLWLRSGITLLPDYPHISVNGLPAKVTAIKKMPEPTSP